MLQILKIMGYALVLLVLLGVFCIAYIDHSNNSKINEINICQDDELIAQLIGQNVNPFSKFRFIKKRNADCKDLLIAKKDEALTHENENLCPIVDDSKAAVIMLIYAYVNDLYDRDSASKELQEVIPLMVPYSYCSNYMKNMIDLIRVKKRFGL